MKKTKKHEHITAMEAMMARTALEEAQYSYMMAWRMAKALVEGKVDSRTLRHAEMIYKTNKDIFEESGKP
ncbi:MAG: hypothetical protein A2163_07750 [Actinobacteria bacterium RBG_13_35_12]|nr:MAG: hypothetical protein A2163_07750 [Actinobacteria bacterium RBG_13_35_12]